MTGATRGGEHEVDPIWWSLRWLPGRVYQFELDGARANDRGVMALESVRVVSHADPPVVASLTFGQRLRVANASWRLLAIAFLCWLTAALLARALWMGP
jgi:hypothetical protein